VTTGTLRYQTKEPSNLVSEWKWLYVRATQKCYIWTSKVRRKEK